MQAYDFLKLFQDQIERETGIRPHVEVKVFGQTTNLSDEQAVNFRDEMVTQSRGDLTPEDKVITSGMLITSDAPWTLYRALDHNGQIEVSVYGPKRR